MTQDDDGTRGITRRTAVKSAVGAVGGAMAAGASQPVAAQSSDPDFGGWFDNVSNFDGVVDKTGQDTVEVTVGASGNNGNFAFGPAAVQVSPGTTVVWRWNGEGGGHNVVDAEGTFDSGTAVAEAGTTFEYTFEETGTFKYVCEPHESLGMKGAVVVAESSGSSGGGEPDYGDWFSNVSNFDGTEDKRGQDTVEVTVGTSANNGNFGFGPAAIHVDAGTTVVWRWNGEGGGHNVVAPDGTFDSGTAVAEAGTTFEYTFEEDGLYTYVCEPHETLGMKGAIVVGTDYPSTGGGGDGGGGTRQPGIRDGGITPGLALFGGSLFLALLSPLAFGLFLRNRFPDVPPRERGEAYERSKELATETVVEEAPVTDDELVEELEHDEFDPRGTLALVLVYLGILVVLWVFMYFVEFLGNGPTVIG